MGTMETSLVANKNIDHKILSIKTPLVLEPRKEDVKREEVNVDEDITREQKEELINLLNRYRI